MLRKHDILTSALLFKLIDGLLYSTRDPSNQQEPAGGPYVEDNAASLDDGFR